jgi:hypothetical protein
MEQIEKKTTGDYALVAGRIATSLIPIPILSAAASELLSLIITPPLEKRRNEWMKEIGERLREVEANKGVNLEDLGSNEKFVSSVINATSYALKTHEKEKLDAFKNAVTHVAIGDAPDEAICAIFLGLIDSFTPWHIRILNLISDPPKWYRERNRKPPEITGGLIHIITDAYPELKNEQDLVNLIWSDLERAGFHRSGSLGGMMSNNGLMAQRTTDLGNRFLRFIC